MNEGRSASAPCVLVFSGLFPSTAEPGAGIFIRERMFRVAQHLPMVVVAPRPWFPGQGLIRLFRPHFRPPAPRFEIDDGIEVHRPRFLSLPGLCKWADGRMMAVGAARTVRRLRRRFDVDIIDAHFLYPDGYAATRIARRLGLPCTITLRGTETRMAGEPRLRRRLARAAADATRLFAVAGSLARIAEQLGASAERIRVIGNGVDSQRFQPQDRGAARAALHIPEDAPVLISVGALVERKGFHRVIECLPGLKKRYPGLCYLIVGGPGPEGDWSEFLRARVNELGLADSVQFLGHRKPDELPGILSAADVFVLATRNEGWANVFLEAMACGLPIVTTDVGGNKEVVGTPNLGLVVEPGCQEALEESLNMALSTDWNRKTIREYAEKNDWNRRIGVLVEEFDSIVTEFNIGRTEDKSVEPTTDLQLSIDQLSAQASHALGWKDGAKLDEYKFRSNAYSQTLRLKLSYGSDQRVLWIKIPRARKDNSYLLETRINSEYKILKDLYTEYSEKSGIGVVKPVGVLNDPLALITEEAPGLTFNRLLAKDGRYPRVFWRAGYLADVTYRCGQWLRQFHDATRVNIDTGNWSSTFEYCEHRLQLLADHPKSDIDVPLAKKICEYLRTCIGDLCTVTNTVAGRHNDFAGHNIIVSKKGGISVLDFSMFDYDSVAFDYFSFIHKLETMRHDPAVPSKLVDELAAAFARGYGNTPSDLVMAKDIVLCRLTVAKLLTLLSEESRSPLRTAFSRTRQREYTRWLVARAYVERIGN